MICYSIALFLLQHLVTYCKLPYCRITQSFKYYLFFFLESRGRKVGIAVLFILNTNSIFNKKNPVTVYNRIGEQESITTRKERTTKKHRNRLSVVTILCAPGTVIQSSPMVWLSPPSSCADRISEFHILHYIWKCSVSWISQLKLLFYYNWYGNLATYALRCA